ncbi:MAG: hypothetical protein KAS71_17790 [Bacteroidales bacterium]|nr:hypothetical protein [Bacteroidales bacterium]
MRRLFKYIVPVVFLAIYTDSVFSQGEFDIQAKILYKNERTFGGFLNSNGLGGDYTFSERINARDHQLYQVEVLMLRHPKEIKISNSYYTNKGFVFGKTNNFIEIKGQWGKQTEVYRKNDASGISVKYFYSMGPTIGILKPIYYEILYTTGVPWDVYTKIEKFTTSVHQTNIYGKASFFEGIREISIIPGISAKFGFNFEYSKDNKSLSALEIGIGADLFPKNIPIMAIETNQFFYLNLFAGYRFGKVIDISEAAKAEEFRDKNRERKLSRKIRKEQKDAAKQTDEF